MSKAKPVHVQFHGERVPMIYRARVIVWEI